MLRGRVMLFGVGCCLAAVSAGAAPANLPPEAADNLAGHPSLLAWPERVGASMDRDTLSGLRLPPRSAVLVARVLPGVEGPSYVYYDAGLGGFSQGFWPASAVKLLAAIGASERLATDYGVDGQALIYFGGGGAYHGNALRQMYRPSLTVSDNVAYDRTLQVAGVEWMHQKLLTPERGFPSPRVQRTYGLGGTAALNRPSLTVRDGREEFREASRRDPVWPTPEGCSTDGARGREQNCASLFELTEGLRRVMLHAEVPEFERFALAQTDVEGIQSALCDAGSAFFQRAAQQSLGGAQRMCHKTGWVPGFHCLDHAYLEGRNGTRYLLAVATPYPAGGCFETMARIGAEALALVAGQELGVPVQSDAGPLEVSWCATDSGRRISVVAPGADRVELWLNGEREEHPGALMEVERAVPDDGPSTLVVRSLQQGTPVGYRWLQLEPLPPGNCGTASPLPDASQPWQNKQRPPRLFIPEETPFGPGRVDPRAVTGGCASAPGSLLAWVAGLCLAQLARPRKSR